MSNGKWRGPPDWRLFILSRKSFLCTLKQKQARTIAFVVPPCWQTKDAPHWQHVNSHWQSQASLLADRMSKTHIDFHIFLKFRPAPDALTTSELMEGIPSNKSMKKWHIALDLCTRLPFSEMRYCLSRPLCSRLSISTLKHQNILLLRTKNRQSHRSSHFPLLIQKRSS